MLNAVMSVHCVPKTRLWPPSVSVAFETAQVAGTFEARIEFFTVTVLAVNGLDMPIAPPSERAPVVPPVPPLPVVFSATVRCVRSTVENSPTPMAPPRPPAPPVPPAV